MARQPASRIRTTLSQQSAGESGHGQCPAAGEAQEVAQGQRRRPPVVLKINTRKEDPSKTKS